MMQKVTQFFADLRLTVWLLGLLAILVFVATLDQVNLGIYFMSQKYFSGVFVWWPIKGGWSLPVFPSGLTLGLLLFINLVVAHFVRFKWAPKKVGLWLIHIGLLLLIFGSAMTKFMAEETQLVLKEGTRKNYTEHQRKMELVFIQKKDGKDHVTVIPTPLLDPGKRLQIEGLPFDITTDVFYANARIAMNPVLQEEMSGLGRRLTVSEAPLVTEDKRRNIQSAKLVLHLDSGDTFWWASNALQWHQKIETPTGAFWMILRPKRDYLGAHFFLEDFSHDQYPGTTIPKNFSSDILIQDDTGKTLETSHIYMNHPLRYEGRTFFQASYAEENTVSILQVVKNPGWLFPYLSTLIMAIGLFIHFVIHLLGYLKRSQKS